jgi:hypothetical protein
VDDLILTLRAPLVCPARSTLGVCGVPSDDGHVIPCPCVCEIPPHCPLRHGLRIVVVVEEVKP